MPQAPETDIRIEALDLMKSLVGLLDEKWVTAHRFLEITRRHGIDQTQARISLITGLKTLARTLPVGVFADAESRDRLLQAAQEALDQVIDEEEAKA